MGPRNMGCERSTETVASVGANGEGGAGWFGRAHEGVGGSGKAAQGLEETRVGG